MKRTSNDPKNSHPEFEVIKFLWCHNSVFPNNYLYHGELKIVDLESESREFKNVIYKVQNEIQAYIKKNRKWFIPASIYKEYNFGHHGASISKTFTRE